jgi:integrase
MAAFTSCEPSVDGSSANPTRSTKLKNKKPRRSWGTGSLMQETQRTGRVVWIGQVRVDGRQRQRVLGAASGPDGLTKRQAEAALRAFRDETEAQALADAQERASAATLRSIAIEHLAHLRANDTKASTLADYEGYLDGHLLPYFGDVPLETISVRDVEAFVDYQRTEAKHKKRYADGKRKVGLAGSTVINHVNYLHAVFAFAQRREYIATNPVSVAAKPKARKQNTDFSFLTLEQIDQVLDAVVDDYLGPTDRAIILTAAMTGLRQGELIALRWRDVMWEDAVLRVRASVSRGVDGTPKSQTSRREVPMAKRVADTLARHREISEYRADDERVFCHPHTGNPYDPTKLRERFYEAMRSAGLRHMIGRDGGGITFHSLRHTFGTQMASAGVPLVGIRDWLGHADIQTTMIYAKWGKDRAADRALVDRAFGTAA